MWFLPCLKMYICILYRPQLVTASNVPYISENHPTVSLKARALQRASSEASERTLSVGRTGLRGDGERQRVPARSQSGPGVVGVAGRRVVQAAAGARPARQRRYTASVLVTWCRPGLTYRKSKSTVAKLKSARTRFPGRNFQIFWLILKI